MLKLTALILSALLSFSAGAVNVLCTYKFSTFKYSVKIIDANGTLKTCKYVKDIRINRKNGTVRGELYAYEYFCDDRTWAHYVVRDGSFSSGYPGLNGYCSSWNVGQMMRPVQQSNILSGEGIR